MLHLPFFLGIRGGGFRSSLLQENKEEVIEEKREEVIEEEEEEKREKEEMVRH